MKKGVKMVDMSIHDVSGVVGWCLGAYSKVENTYVHHLHTFLHTGSGLYNLLQHPHIVPRPHILYNISTTLYNTLQSTALQHFYSLQPLQHPSALVALRVVRPEGRSQEVRVTVIYKLFEPKYNSTDMEAVTLSQLVALPC